MKAGYVAIRIEADSDLRPFTTLCSVVNRFDGSHVPESVCTVRTDPLARKHPIGEIGEQFFI